MPARRQDFTIGVEEEYQIVDPVTRHLRASSDRILRRVRPGPGAEVQPELHSSQIEIAGPVCRTLNELRTALKHLRAEVIAAAAAEGALIAASGTHPFSHWDDQPITPRERYLALERDYQHIARETVCFGYHVHIGIDDPDLAIDVMNRTRPWLAPLVALGANSPFWLDTDTGYASFRTEIGRRWPTAGVPDVLASRAEYDRLVELLLATGSIADPGNIYWDVRPSSHSQTVEFRVTDVCMTVDEAILIAGLCRAMARTCYARSERGEPCEHPGAQVLASATWRAARHGLSATLVDVCEGVAVPAPELVRRLLSFTRDALEEDGEWDEISSLAEQTIGRGTGAERQRAAHRRAGRLEDVVDLVVEQTAAL